MRLTALLLALLSPAAWAAEESAMNAADVSWMMVATTLVLFMTIPGIALFYAGMVRKKNVLSVVMQSFAILLLDYVVWYVCGTLSLLPKATSLSAVLTKFFSTESASTPCRALSLRCSS